MHTYTLPKGHPVLVNAVAEYRAVGPERVIVFVDRARVTTTHVLRRQGKAALDANDEGWPAGVVSDSAPDRDSGTGLSHSIIKRLRCAPRYCPRS